MKRFFRLLRSAPPLGVRRTAVAAALLAGLAALAVAAPPARAEAGEGERWRDPAFGISLEPPPGASVEPRPGDEALVRLRGETGEALTLKLRTLDRPVDLETLFNKMRADLLVSAMNIVEVDDDRARQRFAGRESAVRYFVLDQKNKSDEILGVAVIPLDGERFLDARCWGEAQSFDALRSFFEDTLGSLSVPDARELYGARERWLRRGDELIDATDLRAALAAAPAEQWFRIRRDGGDAGFRRVRLDEHEELGLRGVRIRVDQALIGQGQRIDRTAERFCSFDGTTEVWSSRSTRRLNREVKGLPGRTHSWSETGLRSPDPGSPTGSRIDATRELPTGKVEQRAWPTPGNAYASVAARRLLLEALVRSMVRGAPPEKIAFYSYDSESHAVTLRSVTPTPQSDGTFALEIRPAPTQPAHRHVYDAEGVLLRAERGGLTFERSSRPRIEALWRTRGNGLTP